ncbi:MAG: hypothetical protein JXB35_06765 [Anaerolineae bacterium]|nr:hypothetical protein [Anaerolineae bacterium]
MRTPKVFHPSFQALALADQIIDALADGVPGFEGRIGTAWYWRLSGGILVTFELDYTVTEQRWDVLRATASSPNAGIFNAADFPFAIYGTLLTSPPFIHDLEGEAEWSNRLYFQMGRLIEAAAHWLAMLQAAIIDPQIRPPTAFPELSALERDLVWYALEELNGNFRLSALHKAFGEHISRRQLARTAQRWEDLHLLTEQPRRVTVALRALAEAGAP